VPTLVLEDGTAIGEVPAVVDRSAVLRQGHTSIHDCWTDK
jgi:hypothetical protein